MRQLSSAVPRVRELVSSSLMTMLRDLWSYFVRSPIKFYNLPIWRFTENPMIRSLDVDVIAYKNKANRRPLLISTPDRI